MNPTIKLADGTFIDGTVGQTGDRLELKILKEDVASHLLDLMDPEKTKLIGFYMNQLVAEYSGYVFFYLQPSTTNPNKIDVWMEKK